MSYYVYRDAVENIIARGPKRLEIANATEYRYATESEALEYNPRIAHRIKETSEHLELMKADTPQDGVHGLKTQEAIKLLSDSADPDPSQYLYLINEAEDAQMEVRAYAQAVLDNAKATADAERERRKIKMGMRDKISKR